MVLICLFLCRSVSLSLFFFPIPFSLFSQPHYLSILPSALLQPISMPSAYAPIFIPFAASRYLSASFPFLALRSIPP